MDTRIFIVTGTMKTTINRALTILVKLFNLKMKSFRPIPINIFTIIADISNLELFP